MSEISDRPLTNILLQFDEYWERAIKPLMKLAGESVNNARCRLDVYQIGMLTLVNTKLDGIQGLEERGVDRARICKTGI